MYAVLSRSRQRLAWLAALAVWPVLAAGGGLPVAGPGPAGDPGLVAPVPSPAPPNQVYDIALDDAADLFVLLTRLEELAQHPRPASEPPTVALVLHGPEVEFFAIGNYARYRELVDLAGRLDAFGVIEVKVCQTRMRQLGLSSTDMPAFIEEVPFGPAEVERLIGQGYIAM